MTKPESCDTCDYDGGLHGNHLVLVKWLRGGSNVSCLNLLCQIYIVHAVCCGCLLKRNVDVI